MEIVIALSVLFAFGSACLGVWLGIKYYALRLLALEQTTEITFLKVEDKINELQRVANREQKRDAINTRWKKRDQTDEQTLQELDKIKAQATTRDFDPVSWMNGK
jgi:hypothetical protein